MPTNSDNRLEAIFHAAKDLASPEQREVFLRDACQGDAALLNDVNALLQASAQAEKLFRPTKVNDATALAMRTPLAEQVGDRIGRYKLLQQIGEGGCGVVYMAEQSEPVKRRVALKVIKLGMDTKSVIARFEAERQALAMMDHPNIAKVLDAGATDSGRPYFVMELVRGMKITEYCDEAKLPMRQRLELFIQVCQAVQHAHQKGIIHRDIKPSNILVTVNDGVAVPKVIDFGIAKATNQQQLTDKTLFTAFEQFIGTPAYMSPEQAVMTSLDVDTRSDIYSLGVLLYEMLTGQTPIDAKELLSLGLDEMRRVIRENEPVRPSTRLSTMLEGDLTPTAKLRQVDVPKLIHQLRGDLDWIVMKALEKDRARRYETANGLAMDVQRHLNNEPVVARPPSAAYRFQKLVRRNKVGTMATAAVATALLVGLGLSTLSFMRERSARRQAEVQRQLAADQGQRAESEAKRAEATVEALRKSLYLADMSAAQQALNEGNRGLAGELVRKYLHQESAEDLRGWEWRYLWKLCQGQEQFTVTGHSGRVLALAFDPESKTLFSGGSFGFVKIWDLASLKEVATHRVGTNSISALAVSPTGEALFVGWYEESGVAVRDGPSLASERQLPGARIPFALSPDGATLVTGGTNGIIIWDAVNLKKLHTLGGPENDQLDLSYPPGRTIAFSPDGANIAMAVRSGGQVEVKLWNASSLRADGDRDKPALLLQRGTNDLGRLNVLAFSRDGQILATGQNHGVQAWDAKTGLLLSKSELSVEVYGIVFPPDGKTMATHNAQQDFRVWDISDRTNIVSVDDLIPGHLNEVEALTASANGQTLASGSKDGTIKVWSASVFQERPGLKDQIDAQNIGQIGFSQDSRTMLTISLNSSLTFSETATLQSRASHQLPGNVRLVVISPQGNQLAVGFTNGALQIWTLPGGEKAPALHRQLLSSEPNASERLLGLGLHFANAFPFLAWSADGKRLAASLGSVHVWDVITGQLIRTLLIQPQPNYSIALSPDGKILAAGLVQNVELWDLTSGDKLSTCVGHKENTLELAFSPDGKTLATANVDNTAGLWHVPSGRLKAHLTSHTAAIFHLAFSPDGRTLATRGGDDALKLWNVETGRELLTLRLPHRLNSAWGPHFGGVKFSPDGSLLGVGLLKPPRVQFWRAPRFELIEAAEPGRSGQSSAQLHP
ncbi:MAG: protein kinase [Verrucomicrobiales bacterium]|nr:protein kinase [Verrucomicrobiales bacterium]